MKLVTKSTDTNYLYTLASLLEANGIPASIQGENTARMITPFLMTQPSLWVYIDEQQQEALRLINDTDYIVKNKVDVEEFYKINSNITSDTTIMNKVYLRLGVTVAGWLLGAYILLQVLIRLTT